MIWNNEMVRRIFILVAFLGISTRVLAIATANDGVSAESPIDHGYGVDWRHVFRYKNATAVAVDHYWLLTAAHVADDATSATNLLVDGETYVQREVVFHDTADLALVRFDKPFPGYYPLFAGELSYQTGIGRNRVTIWSEMVMMGYGYPGTVASNSFTQTGYPGTLRWGTNRGESVVTAEVELEGVSGVRSTQCVQTSFELGDTPYEAGGNTFDSGGPMFVQDGTEWALAAVVLYRNGTETFDGNRAALVSSYIDWVKSVVVDYDSDMDGLPDWWETLHAGDAVSMLADVDLDADGFSNYGEWIADTHPTNNLSFLEIGSYTNAASLSFAASTNREYRVEFRTDLSDTNESWAVETDWMTGNATQPTVPVSTSTASRFYRVRARLP